MSSAIISSDDMSAVYHLSTHMPGMVIELTEPQEKIESTLGLFIGKDIVYAPFKLGVNQFKLQALGQTNVSTDDLLLEHAFFDNGLKISADLDPLKTVIYTMGAFKGIEAGTTKVGFSYQNSPVQDAITLKYSVPIEEYNSELVSRYTSFFHDNEDNKTGNSIFIYGRTTLRVEDVPYRISVGYRTFDNDISTPLEATDYLYSYYAALNEKKYMRSESTFFAFESSNRIEKTTLFHEIFLYPNWGLTLFKTTLEYPLDTNKGLLLQAYYSTGESSYGLRANLIWRIDS